MVSVLLYCLSTISAPLAATSSWYKWTWKANGNRVKPGDRRQRVKRSSTPPQEGDSAPSPPPPTRSPARPHMNCRCCNRRPKHSARACGDA